MRNSRAATLDAAVDRARVQQVYEALPERLQAPCHSGAAVPPAGVARLAVAVVAVRGDRVLMLSQPDADAKEHFDQEDPRIAAAQPFKGRSWALPDAMVGPAGIEAAVAEALAQCTLAGAAAFTHTTLGVAALEDFPSLQNDAWLRLTVAVELSGAEAAMEALPADASFGWVPLDLLQFNTPLALQSLDLLNVFENIPGYPRLIPETAAVASADKLLLAPLAPSPALPEHVVEAMVLSAPAAAPAHAHVLLVEDAATGHFALPSTHVARGETFAFAAGRAAHHGFGLALEANVWAPVAVRGGLPVQGVLAQSAGDETVRGVRMTLASLTAGRVAAEDDDPTMLSYHAHANGVEGAFEVWPTHKPVSAPKHRWADLAAVEELAAAGLLVDGLREELERALGRVAQLAVESAPTMLGMPICVTVESLSKANQEEQQQQQQQ
jgi:hypothetical protein